MASVFFMPRILLSRDATWGAHPKIAVKSYTHLVNRLWAVPVRVRSPRPASNLERRRIPACAGMTQG